MLTLTITRGLPASGKSTWASDMLARNPGMYKVINKDSLRAMLDNGKWSKRNEAFVIVVRDRLVLDALEAGYHVIVDDTNLAPHHIPHLTNLVKGKASVSVQDFTHVGVEECVARDQTRPHYVGERVIRRMYAQYLKPPPPAVPYRALPPVLLCDLDGTLALFGDANPYDRAFMQDTLNAPVLAVLRAMRDGHRCDVAILSGRMGRFRDETEAWLRRYDVPYDLLVMRAEGDTRKDAIIKREMYDAHIRDRYTVTLVLDDRDQVVRLWRDELGLPCFQVAWGDF